VTFETSIPGVFAAGDVVTGAATVVEAIGAGKEVAISIDRLLRRKDLAAGRAQIGYVLPEMSKTANLAGRAQAKRLPGEERRRSHEEVTLGFTEEIARQQAGCCLHCGVPGGPDGARVSVADYLKAQRRFRHLTQVDIEKIEARVNEDYEALLERCGLKA
jgi:hypothetical protein